MWLIAGLGNPGVAYTEGRHNVGFMVVEEVARRSGQRFRRRRWESLYAEGSLGGEQVILIKPLSFMNQSGRPISAWLQKASILPEKLIVIHDDLDLAFGRIRVVAKGRHGGHQGVLSIQEALETITFPRVRVGIGKPDKGDEVKFVLAPFLESEARRLPEICGRAADAVQEIVVRGVASSMNRFNVRSLPPNNHPRR